MSTIIDRPFLERLASLHAPDGDRTPRFNWYLTAAVALGGMNYPEEIPALYKMLLEDYIPEAEQMGETRKLREGLTKACGIWGAAKTGSATRALATATPEHLMDYTCYRESEDTATAFERGREMLDSIYPKIPGYNISLTESASPDYAWIANKLLYGHVFSFPKILGTLETGQVIVAALLSIDCQEQVRNHMMGMMLNGANREEVQGVRAVVVAIAERLGVKGKKGRTAIDVPEKP